MTLKARSGSVRAWKEPLPASNSGPTPRRAKSDFLSTNSVWVCYGSDLIPYSGTYKGKEEVVRFIGNIVSSVDILDFKVEQIISNGKTVVVLGSEKQKIKKNSKILEQNWVQVYTVENGLITKMDEYANTAYSEKLFKK